MAAGETRVGLLFGAVEERKPKIDRSKPVRGRSSGSYSSDGEDGRPKVVVTVAAVMEVDAGFQQHGWVWFGLNGWWWFAFALDVLGHIILPDLFTQTHTQHPTHIHRPGHRLDDRGLYLHFHHSASSSSSKSKQPPSPDATDAAADAKSARNPDVARAVQVAGFMGLKPVGWVVARPGGVLPGMCFCF